MFKWIIMLYALIAAGDAPLKNAPKGQSWAWVEVGNEEQLEEAADRLNNTNTEAPKKNPPANKVVSVRLQGDSRIYVAIVRDGKFSLVRHKNPKDRLDANNVEDTEDKDASHETYNLYSLRAQRRRTVRSELEAPIQRSRASSSSQRTDSEPQAKYVIRAEGKADVELQENTQYRDVEKRFTGFTASFTLKDLIHCWNHRYILIELEGVKTLLIVHRPRQSALRNSRGRGSREVQIQIPEGKEETYVLTYGKHIESENRFQEGTKEDAQGDGTRIYAKIMSDIDTIQRATQKSKLDPEIYVLRENQILNQNQIVDEGKITWAYGQAIDPTHGLEPNYISSQMVKFTKAIAASAHFQDPFENNDKTREEKTFSIMNPRDIERVAVLDDQYLRFYYRFFSPIFYVKTRNKETDQFISLYMKQSDSNQFRMVKFEVDRLEDTLKIKVGGPDSVSKQLEKVVLYNIAQDATDKALFLGLAQLKDKSKIEQVKILHDFFTGKNNVGVEFKNATPGLYITKQKSNTEWDLTEYYKETEGEIGAGSLVYIANGKSLMCQTKSDSIEKPLDQLVANDMQISDADHSKKTFTKLFKAIISGIKVQYGEQTVAEPKVVIDYLAEYFKGRKIFGFNTKDDKYDPVEISSSDGDTVTLELTKKVEDKDMVKYLDLDMLCVAGDNTALKNHNPNITKGRGNNPTDEEVTFEDQVKILLQFFLTEMQQRKTGLYNQRIVLHQAKLDEWKVGSTDAFLENNNNQYICLRDQDYLKTGHTKPETKDWFEDKSTIPYINTRFSDSDSSKESLNAILEAMFRKKIKCYFDREIKYFFYRCLKNPEFSRKIINAAIACVARKNEFETEYPEPPIVEITDKEYRHDKTITTHFKFEITSVNGNNVETKTILYKVDEYDLYPYEA